MDLLQELQRAGRLAERPEREPVRKTSASLLSGFYRTARIRGRALRPA
jgi:hypothetical protein